MTTGAGSPFGVWTGASPFTLGETSAPTPLSTLDSGSAYAAVWEFHPDGPHSVAFSAAGSDADISQVYAAAPRASDLSPETRAHP